MPHAADYRQAAARYTRLAEDLHRQAAALSGPTVQPWLGSGSIATAVSEHLAWVVADLSWAGDEMGRLAAECRWRADVCEAYRLAVRAWWASSEVTRGRYPSQPYVWVPLS